MLTLYFQMEFNIWHIFYFKIISSGVSENQN